MQSQQAPQAVFGRCLGGDNGAIEEADRTQETDEPAELEPAERPRARTPAGVWAGRAAGLIVPVEDAAGVVYGIIAIGAVLAAESGRHESHLDTFGSAVLAAFLYWLAHAYAGVLGRRLTHCEALTLGALGQALTRSRTIFRGAAVPLLGLAIAWAAGAAQETAVGAAVWCAVGAVVLFELLAGIRSRAAPAELALEIGIGATMGAGVILLRALLH